MRAYIMYLYIIIVLQHRVYSFAVHASSGRLPRFAPPRRGRTGLAPEVQNSVMNSSPPKAKTPMSPSVPKGPRRLSACSEMWSLNMWGLKIVVD